MRMNSELWKLHSQSNDRYINAARTAYPSYCENEYLAVGWKITHTDGTSSRGYHWPQVTAGQDFPVLHVADAWDETNMGACPRSVGDGFCLVPQCEGVTDVTSGGARLASCVGHVLVYPLYWARGGGDKGGGAKRRVPWVIDVDCVDVLLAIRKGFLPDLKGADLNSAELSSADLRSADLRFANLRFANLRSANLRSANLYSANLRSANLRSANLRSANLRAANLYSADLHHAKANWATSFPHGFDWKAAGVVMDV